MTETIMPCFDRFPREGSIIGRLLAGYGELELELCQCVGVVRDDMDAAIKAMFRVQGGQNRINKADSLAKSAYESAGLGKVYCATIADLHWCRTTRNQYAHCHWYDATFEGICFYDLESLATQSDQIGFVTANRHSINVELLERQEVFFKYVQKSFWHLKWAYSDFAKRPMPPPVPQPLAMARPPKHN